ncbi:MAG: TonB-dependent receptor [Melioribacteraceae bacterium]|nr:TonB-dependent receptor [Melioribacteraceae bacterium]MCF8353152.1 TonB-dependent receptor [Melioribacteraceae bacterium]MCF8393148.1 TonB-dependent receptor [Melioribacteraceae bacterium]
MKTLKFLFVSLILVLSFNPDALAQSRGKIRGTVIEQETGEPLPGVNVMLIGTNLGATTDIDGTYYIIGVPANEYDLKATFIGYHQVTVQGVRVKTDLTTEINIELVSTSIEMPEVTVTAQTKLVQRDITSTRKTVTKETIKDIPGLESSADVFRLQGGTFVSQVPQRIDLEGGQQLQVRDESVKDVHIRGGRGGEILFMIDGVPVNHPLYGGRSVLDLNVVAVEQIELLTGAFSAEYGQAQSGVVNITTRTGSAKMKAGLEYKTDEVGFLSNSYGTQYGSIYLGGPELLSTYVLPAIGIDLPGEFYYFFTMNAELTNTAYNNHRTRDQFSLFGLDVDGKQKNTKNMTAKLNWDMTRDIRTTFSFNGAWLDWSDFHWSWRDYPNNTPSSTRDNININAMMNHVLSQNAFYSLNLGYLGIKYKSNYFGMNPRDFWVIGSDSVYTTVKPPQVDPLTNFYNDEGVQTIWRNDETHTFTLKADFTWQFHSEHLLKAGIETQYNDINYIDIQDGAYKLSNYGEYRFNDAAQVPAPPGPFKEFGQTRWVFHVYPLIGGFYLQEKFEKEFIVLNAGIRADWVYLGKTIDGQGWRDQWERATGFNSDWDLFKMKFSPRFGISFPILEQTVIFFSYGHFNQLPELTTFYRDPYSGGFTGNPKLDYEQTILYEFGFTHQLFNHWAIDVKSYAKDISGQVGTTGLQSAGGVPVSLYDNVGYARARGLEFEVTKGYSNFTSGKVTYTVQWANGYSSSQFDDYIRSQNDFPKPIRERRLGWDIRHQIIAQVTLASPENMPMNIFGLELPDDWNLTFITNFYSGQPYTPGTTDPAEQQKLENTSTGPVTTTTDIKFQKGFNIFGTKLSFVVDVFNLFDQNNVTMNGFNVWTGEPFKYGDLESPSSKYYDWYRMVSLRNPMQYSTGRYVKMGFRWDF